MHTTHIALLRGINVGGHTVCLKKSLEQTGLPAFGTPQKKFLPRQNKYNELKVKNKINSFSDQSTLRDFDSGSRICIADVIIGV